MSATDIHPGQRWAHELADSLASTSIGILCLTPENLSSPWLLFEAGSLAKTVPGARVIPYLLKLSPDQLSGPLTQFQAVQADHEGTQQLALTIAAALPEQSMLPSALDALFEQVWPMLDANLKEACAIPASERQQRISKSRRFWEPFFAEGPPLLVIGHLKAPQDGEKTGYLAFGDARALGELQSHFQAIDLPVPEVIYDDRVTGDAIKSHLILVGGPEANIITREALLKIGSNLSFADKASLFAVYDSVTDTLYKPKETSDQHDICVDYSIILRAPNPFALSKQCLVIAGSWGFGTWAGARFIVSNKGTDVLTTIGEDAIECILETDVLIGTPQDIRLPVARRLTSLYLAKGLD